MARTQPYILRTGHAAQAALPLPRIHEHFDERFIQELLVGHPELLPAATLRPDVGDLICIGREVPTRDSGIIDNLYLTTSGYIVVVETKLWRNPQSRREVVSQVLDYVKDVVTRDFGWLESVWEAFRKERGLPPQPLLEAMGEAGDDEYDESEFADRVHRVIDRGDIIALIVGDGIDTRLQQLVSHLCRDSAHLRYSLGLVSLRCYQWPDRDEMLVLPELVQEVEPVQRAYVRIEMDAALAEQTRVVSVAEQDDGDEKKRPGRSTLSEDDLYEALATSLGADDTNRVRTFVGEMEAAGLEADYKSAAVMLKVPDPSGEANGSSLLAIEKAGRIYNPDHGHRQMIKRWGWERPVVDHVVHTYWRRLNEIDKRFPLTGISHLRRRHFLPLNELVPHLDAIGKALKQAVADIQREADKAA